MERLQRMKKQIGMRWKQVRENKGILVVITAVLFLAVGVGIGVYSYPRSQDTPVVVPQLTEEDVVLVVREHIQTILALD